MTRDTKKQATTKVQITANPFVQATTIIINGQIVDFECTHGRNTQGWVDEIFYKIYDHINGIESLSLVFHGLTVDYEDIVNAAKVAAHDMKFSLFTTEHIPVHTAEERLSEMKAVISEICNNTAIKEFQSEGFRADLERILAPDFAIHVLATMSAGKSTLINAMMGKDILPAKNQACTATMTAIHDSKEAGDGFIGKAWDGEGNLIASCGHLTRKDVEEWNQDSQITDIDIWGNISAIKTSRHASLVLVDTPGPNNSQNFEHRKTTFKNIEKSDMSLVLYVMNATQLGVDDDKALLERICKVINEGGRAARDRFLFVLNKIDELNPEKEPVEQVLANARKYLSEVGIKDARVFPTAAQTTKLARMDRAGQELDRRERSHFNREYDNIPYELQTRIFDCLSVSPSVRHVLQQAWDEAHAAGNNAAQVEIFGGVPVIEAVIAEYMEKYANVHKVADAGTMLRERYEYAYQKEVTDLERIISSSDNELKKLNEDIEKLKDILSRDDFRKAVAEEIGKKKDIPDDVEKAIRECRKLTQNVIRDLENGMAGTADPYTAEKTLSAARGKIDSAAADLCNFLESQFDSLQEKSVVEYKKIYDECLSHIISQIDSNSSVFFRLKSTLSIEKSMLGFSGNIVDRYTRTFTERRGNPNKAWYKPWTWGDDEYTVTQKKVVSLADIYNKEILPTMERFDKIIEDAKGEIRKLSLRLKTLFECELMPRAEVAMGEYLSQLQNNINNKDSVEIRLGEAKNTKRYLERIKARIDAIVSF